MPLINVLEAVNMALETEMKKDERIVVYGEDAGFEGGVFRATAGLQKAFGEARVFDSPIAEAAIVGSAIGMAINGLKPVVELQFSGFMFPGYNQIVTHAARYRNRSRGKYHLPMVIRMPYGGGVKALEHHSESLETLFSHIPGLKLVIPSTPYDALGLLRSAMRDPDPVIFMEPKRIYRAFKQEVPEADYVVPLGKAKIVQKGEKLTVVAWGAMIREIQLALDMIKDDNLSVELIDLRTIQPFDLDTIVTSVKKTGKLLVVHEAVKSFGPAAEIIQAVSEKAFYHLEAAPTRLTAPDITVPLPRGEHHFMIHPKQIASAIKDLIAKQA